MSVIGAIEPTLASRQRSSARRRKRPDSLDAYDLYLRALPLASTCMPEDADKALSRCSKQADRGRSRTTPVAHAMTSPGATRATLRAAAGLLEENSSWLAIDTPAPGDCGRRRRRTRRWRRPGS